MEILLEKGFEPTRSIVLAYGIDEERGGILVRAKINDYASHTQTPSLIQGATAIRDFLLSNYGEEAFSILVDEGGMYSATASFQNPTH